MYEKSSLTQNKNPQIVASNLWLSVLSFSESLIVGEKI
jgi:hypothetical protein